MNARVSGRAPAAPASNGIRGTVVAIAAISSIVAIAIGIVGWLWPWLREPAVPTDASESTADIPAVQPAVPPARMATSSPPVPRPPTAAAGPVAKASGHLHLEEFAPAGGGLNSVDMAVGGGLALWEPREHRLRVLLVDEALSPSLEHQMLDYLQTERLSDSGRSHAVLELHFRPDARTFDREGLQAASLSVTSPDGAVTNSFDVLKTLKLNGSVPPASGGSAGGAQSSIELSSSGGGAAAGPAAIRDSWQLSVALPVSEAH